MNSRYICFAVMLVLGATGVQAAEKNNLFMEWLSRWTISLGAAVLPSADLSGGQSVYTTSFRDGFGDTYNFQIDQGSLTSRPTPFGVCLRFPLYWNGDWSLMGQSFAIAKTWNVGQNISGLMLGRRFGNLDVFIGFGGTSVIVSGKVGEIKAAFSGDPGLYYDGSFHKPGTSMTIYGYSSLQLSGALGLKYQLGDFWYFGADVAFFPGSTVTKPSLLINGVKGISNVQLQPISVSSSAGLLLSLGLGI